MIVEIETPFADQTLFLALGETPVALRLAFSPGGRQMRGRVWTGPELAALRRLRDDGATREKIAAAVSAKVTFGGVFRADERKMATPLTAR